MLWVGTQPHMIFEHDIESQSPINFKIYEKINVSKIICVDRSPNLWREFTSSTTPKKLPTQKSRIPDQREKEVKSTTVPVCGKNEANKNLPPSY